MSFYKFATVLALMVGFTARGFSAEASRSVRQILVRSHWVGLSRPADTELVIRSDKGGYLLGRRRVDKALVDALVEALQEPEVPRPDLLNLGITKEWLVAHEDPSVESALPFAFEKAASDQKALFHSAFTDPALVAKALPSLFGFVRTDDYPSVEVTVSFDDGSTLSASSHSQYLFMLPWNVARNGGTVVTYNANVSRALAALMPDKAVNRSRISGDGLNTDLAQAVARLIEEDWKMLGVENRAGGTLAKLRTQYVVESADINAYHNVYYGKKWSDGSPHETNLHVTLTKQRFSKSFSDEAILLYDNGKVSGADEFLRKAGAYEKLVGSVPWLSRFRQENPTVLVQLVFVHDRSFSEKAMAVFSADMKAKGKEKLADEVGQLQERVALLAAGFGAYWLVLPDQRMVLWRYSRRAGLLKWDAADFAATRCTDYPEVTGGCVGAVVSPDGTLATEGR
jgi:hypothetical protein